MSTTPSLTIRYTVEELAIIADLYDLSAIPGCPPAELTRATRGLATRALIARNVLAMPPQGGVEVQQPHATVIGTIFAANDVVQHIKHRPRASVVEHWFVTDPTTVHVSAVDGIVTMALHDGRVLPEAGPALDQAETGTAVRGFDELITVHRSAEITTVDRLITNAVDG